jgi:hypothetical protein
MLGMAAPDEPTLRARLIQSISNSRKKKYHGNDEKMNQLPKIQEQALAHLNDVNHPFELFNEEMKVFLSD